MSASVLIKDLGEGNKPRERLIEKGVASLSDIELLAIIIRSGGKNISALGLASHLLKKYKNLKTLLELELKQLINQRHVGPSKACTIKAVGEICKRSYLVKENTDLVIRKPEDVYRLIKKDLYAKKQEHLYLISLDSRKKYISKELICIGSVNETLIPVREIIRKSLINNAVHIIIVHNHPSNDSSPSQEDIVVTEKIANACLAVGITLLDHIVTSDDSYTSIKSLGMFESTNLIKKGGE